MPFQVTKPGRAVVESFDTLGAAERAFWIFTAQELKHDRVADYSLDTRSAVGVCEPHLCKPALPDWAIEVLKQHGFEFP